MTSFNQIIKLYFSFRRCST